MAKNSGRFKASANPSFTDLLESDAQRQAWEEFDQSLRFDLIIQEIQWTDAVWERFQQAADKRFPDALKGLLLRAKQIEGQQPGLASRMLLRDMATELCASVYVARYVAALDAKAPLALFALSAASDDANHPGDVALLRYLLSSGANPSVQLEHRAALHAAALRRFPPVGHPRAIAMLLDAGADPDPHTENGTTPMLVLCGYGEIHDSVAAGVRALRARGARFDAVNDAGQTPVALLRTGAPKEHPESDQSKKNRRELLGEFEQDDLDALLPMGAPSVSTDIDGVRR